MAGAWELSNNPTVLVVILTRELTSVAWAFGFKNLIIPGTFTGLSGMPFDHARNVGCQKTLELGYDYCLFLDDDVIPPNDAILRLLSHKKPIVSGLYYRRNNPITPVMLKNTEAGRNWITEYNVPDLLEVDYVGSGCLLISKEVLMSLPPLGPKCHWFEWRCDRTDLQSHERMSEDFVFCEHARKHGYKIYVDTSIQCKHAGLAESKLPGQLSPLELM